MRELINIVLLTLLVAVVMFCVTPPKKKVIHVSALQIHDILNSGNALFLDARPFEEYAEGHIEGAINIPIHDASGMDLIFKLEDMLQSAPQLVLYCNGEDCELSDILAKKLKDFGISEKKILVFKGGIEEWKQSGYPVSTDTEFQKLLLQ